jgi:hypothetical protein
LVENEVGISGERFLIAKVFGEAKKVPDKLLKNRNQFIC